MVRRRVCGGSDESLRGWWISTGDVVGCCDCGMFEDARWHVTYRGEELSMNAKIMLELFEMDVFQKHEHNASAGCVFDWGMEM